MVRATWDRWDEAGPDRSPGRSLRRRRGKGGSSLLLALSQRFDLRAYFTRIQSVAEILVGCKGRSPLEARDFKATRLERAKVFHHSGKPRMVEEDKSKGARESNQSIPYSNASKTSEEGSPPKVASMKDLFYRTIKKRTRAIRHGAYELPPNIQRNSKQSFSNSVPRRIRMRFRTRSEGNLDDDIENGAATS